MYVENMLRLESGAIGETVGSIMLPALVDRLRELDVSWLILKHFVKEKLGPLANNIIPIKLVVGGNWMGWNPARRCQRHI